MADELTLRRAAAGDIPALVEHRRRMFEDISNLNGRVIDPQALDAMDAAYRDYLQAQAGTGSLTAWLVCDGETICASGGVVLQSGLPPHHTNLAGCKPLLHSVYTLPEYRRLGLARHIVEQAIAYCTAQGYPILELNASSEGRPLYEQLGFQPGSQMRLRLPKSNGS